MNPLREVHEQAQAEFQPYADVEIVSTFGEPQAEYAAIRKGCALMDLPQRGILEATGKDRLEFLNSYLTNEVWNKEKKSGLQPGQGAYAFLLNNKGRIVSDLNVLEVPAGDRTLLEMDARMVETVRAALDRYLFNAKVTLTSKVGSLHEIVLHGPRALDVLNQILDAPIQPLQPLAASQSRALDTDIVIWRDDPASVPGYHLIVSTESARKVWMTLISRFAQPTETLGKRQLRPTGWAAFNATRIEGGRPLFGIDFDDSVLPAETGEVTLARAVSFTKGCYLGQEIVARMHARGQVARQIVGLKLEHDHLPIAGAQLFDDQQNQIGGITSSTVSPVLSNVAICLGFVKKPFVAEGTRVKVPAEGSLRDAIVTRLPFVELLPE
jgi:aminomethyltransferase